MILELDIGNSRVKWRQITDDGKVFNQGIVPGVKELQEQAELALKPTAIRACSVRKGDAYEEVKDWLESKYEMSVETAGVKRQWGGVSIHYEDPSRLGVDRWLAMLAAYSAVKGTCIIVDAGTALTIDVLAADGCHQGGYILPGLALMRASLEQNTAIRLNTGSIPASLALGHSTDQAVWNGGLALAVALIEKTVIETSAGKVVNLIFSGGDGQVLAANTDFGALTVSSSTAGTEYIRVEQVPDLVLDGLCIACPLPVQIIGSGSKN
jgi:type III pantothenate kinase|tara:strand:- start:638 stop:1438 length:801 start_codon:yes stop_codon:yes gene_type:complete